MTDLAAEHADWLAVCGAVSLALFVGSLLALPSLLARVPHDYFATRERPRSRFVAGRHPAVRWSLRVAKNLAGLGLVAAGVAMLLLPGQGVLTIFAGVMLLDLPGRRRLELAVIRRPAVLRAVNWIRRRRGRPPLEVWRPD